MGILLEKVRIFGFRGIENLEIELSNTTVVTGMNNSGKTSLLKALQIVFGNRQFISNDDFFIKGLKRGDQIIIDVKIVPVKEDGTVDEIFNEKWETLFTEEKIIVDKLGKQMTPIRTIIKIDPLKSNFVAKQYILPEWTEFKSGENYWYKSKNGKEKSFHFDEIPFFYVDAQRDIVEDMKLRTSYLGKMLSNIRYSKEDITSIEKKIKELNEQAVTSSEVLTNISSNLKGLDTAMDQSTHGVDISPFPKKVRDLNKGVSIQYSDFSMEYHGMGTRSWSSLLTLKSFVSFFENLAKDSDEAFFPIIAIEEPEAHLHPNAQKKLYKQISDIPGQKIISTHSNFITASAKLKEIRNFYKEEESINCGRITVSDFSAEDLRKISRQVVNTRGELFFSKILVFIEGETEEQALPIFAEKYFRCKPFEVGIDFIGVGGFGNYMPFIRVADSLKIPWFIYSDAENTPEKNVKENVEKQFRESGTSRIIEDCIIFIEDGNDFEKQLLKDGFKDEIINAIVNATEYSNFHHKEAKEREIRQYDEAKIYEILTDSKAHYGPAVAEEIVKSKKDLPPKIKELFEKIKSKK